MSDVNDTQNMFTSKLSRLVFLHLMIISKQSHRYLWVSLVICLSSLLISISLSGCGKLPVLETSESAETATYASENGHGHGSPLPENESTTPILNRQEDIPSAMLDIVFENPWSIDQTNAITVQVPPISEDFLLAVEIFPLLKDGLVQQKPVIIAGTPVAGVLEEVNGYLFITRVTPGQHDVRFDFPRIIFDPTLYDALGGLRGWELRATLTSQIIVSPQPGGRTSDAIQKITAADAPESPVFVLSEADVSWLSEATPEYPVDTQFIISESSSGAFFYYPIDSIVQSTTLTSDVSFNFRKEN